MPPLTDILRTSVEIWEISLWESGKKLGHRVGDLFFVLNSLQYQPINQGEIRIENHFSQGKADMVRYTESIEPLGKDKAVP